MYATKLKTAALPLLIATLFSAAFGQAPSQQIGRASCRERVFGYV